MPNQPGPNVQPDAGHVNCRRCGTANTPGCPSCHYCTTCCQCAQCHQCGYKHPRTVCTRCGNCRKNRHCMCGKRAGELNIGKYLMSSPSTLDRCTITPQRCTTVELELSDYLIARAERWVWETTRAVHHHDGTLRGPNCTELLVGPVSGNDLPRMIKEYTRWAAVCAPIVNSTCGMHVHVDGRALDSFAMRRLLRLYRILEPTFYSLVAENRRTNNNSKPIGEDQWAHWDAAWEHSVPGRIKEQILLGVYVPPARHLEPDYRPATIRELVEVTSRHRGNNGVVPNRYRSLNVHSWFYRGTLEFRQHEGCVDPIRIQNWMEWCRWVVEMAARLRDVEVEAIRTPEDFLNGVWKRTHRNLTLPVSLREYVRGGRNPIPLPDWDEGARQPPAGRIARGAGAGIRFDVPPPPLDAALLAALRRAARDPFVAPAGGAWVQRYQ